MYSIIRPCYTINIFIYCSWFSKFYFKFLLILRCLNRTFNHFILEKKNIVQDPGKWATVFFVNFQLYILTMSPTNFKTIC